MDNAPKSLIQSNKKSLCAICNQQVTNARLFPCGHTVCELCLFESPNAQADNSQTHSLRSFPNPQCPLNSCSKKKQPISINNPPSIVPIQVLTTQDRANSDMCNEHHKPIVLYCSNCPKLICISCVSDHSGRGHHIKECDPNDPNFQKLKNELENIYSGDETFKLLEIEFNEQFLHIMDTFALIRNFEADYKGMAIIKVFIKIEFFSRKQIFLEEYESVRMNNGHSTGLYFRKTAEIQLLVDSSAIPTSKQNIELETKVLQDVTNDLITQYIRKFSSQFNPRGGMKISASTNQPELYNRHFFKN